MTNNLQVWHEKVIKSRFITSCLMTDLQRIDKLYGRLTRCSLELYKLRKEVDVEYISVSSVVRCKDEKTRQDFTEKEKDIELEIANLKESVDDTVSCRTKLITSELLQWKNKRGRDYFTKQRERRHIRGGHVIVGELKLTLSYYLNLVKERDALVSNDLKVLIYEDRVKDEHLAYEKEKQRDRENLHNFTARVVSRDEKQILNNGGLFVLKDKTILDDKRKHRIVKRQTELAVLSYVEYLAGLKVKGRRMRGGGSRVNVRKEIMRYFFHPRVGYLERRFINKALKLADFYSVKSVRSNLSLQVRGMSNIISGLKLLEDLSQDSAVADGKEVEAKKVKQAIYKARQQEIQSTVSEKRWQGKFIKNRWDDEKVKLEGCFAWLSSWKNAPTYTIAGVQEVYQQLLPTKVYYNRKTK